LSVENGSAYRFGAFEFDAENAELRKNGIKLKLQEQPGQVLLQLLEHHGKLVSREQLRSLLWCKDTFVDFETGLNTAVKRLRDTLGDAADNPTFIETVPRKGYKFIAPVELLVRDEDKPRAAIQAVISRWKWAIRAIYTSAAVLVLLAAGVAWRSLTRIPRVSDGVHPSSDQRVTLVVLPFQNISGDPTQDYFGDGLTDETITELAQLSPLRLGLIARTSAIAYKNTSKTVAQIGGELAVDYVLEGSVRRYGQHVRVSVQLIRVRDQMHLWAHSYDREIRDLLALESELGEAIAEQVQVELTSQARLKIPMRRTIDPEAHEMYLKARHFWGQFRPESLNQAITFYRQALEKDPHYAAAYAGLAAAYCVRANRFGPAEAYAEARAAAARSLELDDSLAEAHEAMAAVHIFHDWDWSAADKELTRCEELGASSLEYNLRALWFEARGDTSSAISVLKRGLRLDPFSPILNADLGLAYYYARQPDDLVRQYQATREIDPNFPILKDGLALAYLERGDLPAAAAEYQRMGDSWNLAVVKAKQGDVRAARELLKKLQKNTSKESLNPPSMVTLCHAIGDRDCTFNWLEREYADRDWWLLRLRIDPGNDDLRSDARFNDLVNRIGLQ
jgi:TolB-like protein/DNA-binding winged helix-turn-helix (wHTH) protein/Flp pilus assembly protein TadD